MISAPPGVLAVLPGWMPSTLMNVVKPMLALEQKGCIRFRAALEPYLRLVELERADLVIFCRNIDPRYDHVLRSVQERAIPFIYDIDDNLFDVPQELADGAYYHAPGRMQQLTRYLAAASLVRVYSPILLDLVRPLNPSTRLVTPPLDWSLISDPPKRTSDTPLKIVYATSRSDDLLYGIFAPALDRILSEYAGRVSMHFWGYQPKAFHGRPNVHFRRFMLNYDQFLRKFSEQGFDIGLAPLKDDNFHQSKTNNKFREYSACGIAGVYSDVPLYANWVEPGVTGMLAPNTADHWYTAMRELIDRPELRHRIAEAAHRSVQRAYSQEQFLQDWQNIITEALARSHTTTGSAHLPQTFVTDEQEPAANFPPEGWSSILRRVTDSMRSGQIGHSLMNSRIHLNNLWWLFKVNRLKHL